MLVRDLNPDERPLARLENHGAETLSSADLLSIIFGGQTSLKAARYALRDGVSGLTKAVKDSKISPIRRAKIAAVLELSRRLLSLDESNTKIVFTTDSAARFLMARLGRKEREICGVLLLDARLNVLSEHDLFVGTSSQSLISSPDILRTVILGKSTRFVLYHNHPSGDPTPSEPDIRLTANLKASADLLGIELVDHIIVGRSRYYSLHEHGLL